MYSRGPGGMTFQSVRLYQMLITNGTCVSRIMMMSAGSSGSRRRHDSLRRMRGVAWSRPWTGPVVASAVVMALARRRRGDLLAVGERSVDVRPAGDHRGELLRALVPDVLELRDPHVLHARIARPLRRARVVDRCRGHRLQRRLGERLGRLLVLRDLVGGLARARRDRGPAARD